MVDFSGTWKNELTSTMILVQAGDRVAGTYESAVSGAGGKTTGDLQGYADGALISLLVHWRDFQAITAWVGQLDRDAPVQTVRTLWHMTQAVEAGEEWHSVAAGADAFTRAPAA